MDKILEQILALLKIDALNENDQKDIKEKLATLIEVRVAEKVEEAVEKATAEKIDEMEDKFVEFRDSTISRFSEFLDKIIDEEIQLPARVLEFAHIGEMYADILEPLKARLTIDEGAISKELKDLMAEAKSEIVSLRDKVNKLTDENLQLSESAINAASRVYVNSLCEGMTTSQKKTVVGLLEGITDKAQIDRKFSQIKESLNITEATSSDEAEVITEGKGKVEVEPEATLVNEGIDPLIAQYAAVLQNGK